MEPADSPVAFVHHRVELRIRPHSGHWIDHVIRLLVKQMRSFHPDKVKLGLADERKASDAK